ncbi:MAG: hypothetical protein ACRDDY_00755 [Clostridium sp.]|uniref:hypothetical protein n=1 Tax=Clostridium sp. TaxID=1506 RepID=UPI003EE5F1C7
MFKKLISTIMLSTIILSSVTVIASAEKMRDTGKVMDFSYKVYASGSGMVDGSQNNIFYKLTPGKVHANITSRSSSDIKLELVRKGSVFNKSYGSKQLSSTGNYVWDVDTDSSKYYFPAWGGARDTTQRVKGTMHDHRP